MGKGVRLRRIVFLRRQPMPNGPIQELLNIFLREIQIGMDVSICATPILPTNYHFQAVYNLKTIASSVAAFWSMMFLE